MELTLNQQAISLAALMFLRGNASFESSLHDEEIAALQVLKQVQAVVPGVVNSQDAICAFCGLYRGPIFRTNDGLMVQCPDCGPFALDPASQRSWRLDDEWLIRKLRGALDISPHATATQIVDGVWDIGRYKNGRWCWLAASIWSSATGCGFSMDPNRAAKAGSSRHGLWCGNRWIR